MALMDEFEEERKSLKHASLRKRISYFWDYYKWHVIIGIFILSLICTLIYRRVTLPDYQINGYFINTNVIEKDFSAPLIDDFIKSRTPKSTEKNFFFDTSLSFVAGNDSSYYVSNGEIWQIFLSRAATKQLDFMISDTLSMTSIGYQNYFSDLRTVLTEEQFEKFEPYMLYIDESILEKINSMTEVSEPHIYTFPDASAPQEMENAIPVMIDVSSSQKAAEFYDDSVTELAFGIVCTNNLELTIEFADYLLFED